MNGGQLRELLREMREDPVPADSLARVRAGVAARTETRRGGMWKWGALSLAAASVLVMVALWPHEEPPLPLAPRFVAAPLPEPVLPRPPAPKPRIVSRAKPKPAPEPEVVFRIQTEDPEVVILLSN